MGSYHLPDLALYIVRHSSSDIYSFIQIFCPNILSLVSELSELLSLDWVVFFPWRFINQWVIMIILSLSNHGSMITDMIIRLDLNVHTVLTDLVIIRVWLTDRVETLTRHLTLLLVQTRQPDLFTARSFCLSSTYLLWNIWSARESFDSWFGDSSLSCFTLQASFSFTYKPLDFFFDFFLHGKQ